MFGNKILGEKFVSNHSCCRGERTLATIMDYCLLSTDESAVLAIKKINFNYDVMTEKVLHP